jgi:carbamate kinase
MRLLLALGGNAMTGPDGSSHPRHQVAALEGAAAQVADLLQEGHDVVLTHGNGPQVGNILVKQELAASVLPPVPLDWCGAMSQATLGFVLMNALEGELATRDIRRQTSTVVTRTLVAADDPGFSTPTKPIGRFLDHDAAQLMIEHGQTWEDRGEKGWRRVVASPEPLEVIDAPTIKTLLDAGFLVISNGGGGIPVVRGENGRLHGVEAVIDKDLSAVALAAQVEVDALVIATDVENAVVGWGTPHARALGTVTVSELRGLAAEGHFASGSMGPKVDAACRFVEGGGEMSVITTIPHIPQALERAAGTVVVAG